MICRQDDKVLAETRRAYFPGIDRAYRIEWVCLRDGRALPDAHDMFSHLWAHGHKLQEIYMDVRDRDGVLVIRESRTF